MFYAHFTPKASILTRMTSSQRNTILVIEDDAEVRETLADILELNDFKTIVAGNGEEGLTAIKREKPAIVITDLAMPVMSGFELLEALRIDPDLRMIPVIVISAKVDRDANRRAMEMGASDFITKPFSEEEVLHSIATRLEKKELLDELDAFAHTVAHDLKNPLTTLMGRLELGEMMLGQTDETTMRHHLTTAAQAARQLNGIIESLLVLAGVRKQNIVPEALDMGTIAQEAISRLEALTTEHSAQISLPDEWPHAFGYAPWVIEVWVNFISNAAKYGGTNPQITLGGETNQDATMARFWVQDNGPGLDEDAQALMFIPFTSISKVQVKGHGMGLSIVHRIVGKLGGKVGLESAPGKGARFWFELPTSGPTPPHVSASPFAP